MTLKRILPILSLSTLIFTSCKNSLNIQAPYKDVTVVYGLLDQNDPIHYIRINKAFEGIGDAYTMAQQFDSIYYLPTSTISVVLEDSNTTTDAVVATYPLDTTTSIPLSPGTFSYPKQILYYTNASLNPNDSYNLIVTNTKTGKVLRGSTALLSDVALIPNPANNKTFYFGTTLDPAQITWNSIVNGRIYQMSILFYYSNQVGSGSPVAQTPLELVLAPQIASSLAGGISMSYSITQEQLFSLIISSLQYEPGVTRYADSLGITFTTGTDDLNTYIQLNQPPLGINQDIPLFSDVSNGVGLFTARHIQTYYNQIDPETLDSIQGSNAEQRFINIGFQP